MASIAEWIQRIKTAIYGEEVRGAIWQSLQAMNDELTSADVTQIPKNKTAIETLQTDVTNLKSSDTELKGIRVGADGAQYATAGEAVRSQVTDLKSHLSDISDAYSTNTLNLCPSPTASTVNGGYLNSSTGTFGTVEAGKTYTFSATNVSNVGKELGLRIMSNGAWVNQASIWATPSDRFSGSFTATVDGEISLNSYFGADFDPVFEKIQLELGGAATPYVPYEYVKYSANDKKARDTIYAKSIVDECTITDGKYFGNGLTSGQALSINNAAGYYILLIPVKGGEKYTIYGSIANVMFCYFADNNVVVRGITANDFTKNVNVIRINVPTDATQIAITGLDSEVNYADVNVIDHDVLDIVPTKSAIPVDSNFINVFTKAEVRELVGKTYVVNKIYVATDGDDSSGDGSEANPFATVYHAYESITDNSAVNRYEIIVADGTYTDLQTRYSGITGTAYQGIMSKDYVSVKSASGNPAACVFEWDGATGFQTFTEADATYKCFFHLNDHANGVEIIGIKFVGANLRYCLHFETNRESDVLIENCIFDWAGVYLATDDHKNRPVVGMGGSYYQHVTFSKCQFLNSQNTAGIQWHDNTPYKIYTFPLGAIIRCVDCKFDGLNIQVRSYNYDRSNEVFSLELVRCTGLNIVYPTISGGSVNYWRLTDDSNRIIDNRFVDCTDATTYPEQTVVKG